MIIFVILVCNRLLINSCICPLFLSQIGVLNPFPGFGAVASNSYAYKGQHTPSLAHSAMTNWVFLALWFYLAQDQRFPQTFQQHCPFSFPPTCQQHCLLSSVIWTWEASVFHGPRPCVTSPGYATQLISLVHLRIVDTDTVLLQIICQSYEQPPIA